jgi:hypothetical protein
VSDAVTTCDDGLLCSTLLSTEGIEGAVIREEGTTDDYTVESVVLGQVFARDSSNNPVVLDDVPGNYAFCFPPAEGVFESQKLNENLCTECIFSCPDDLLCQGKCDGSWFNLLFCTFTSGVCVPDGTASACE